MLLTCYYVLYTKTGAKNSVSNNDKLRFWGYKNTFPQLKRGGKGVAQELPEQGCH